MVELIKQKIEEIFDEVVALRREIHMYPELSGEEQRTMELVSNWLTKLNIPHETNVGGHGVVATIGDPNAAFAVGIRADMDALPIEEQVQTPFTSKNVGVMHACGHDMHTAILMGTAKLLKDMEDRLPGAVKLFFQPAEEKGGGARQMIEAGCLQQPPVKRVLALHVNPDMPAGEVSFMPGRSGASSTTLRITVNGRACHGAHPERGVDAIIAAAHVLTGLQSISSRSVAPTTPVIVTVGKIQGGTKGNIVAGTVEMEGTIRALDLETTELVKQRVKDVAESAAACCGATADVYMNTQYPPLINDEATALEMLNIASKVLGEEKAHLRTEPSLGAEDFAFFTLACPGAIFRLGVGQDNGHPQMLHNEWFCPDEEGMKTGMLLEVLGVLHFLQAETQ